MSRAERIERARRAVVWGLAERRTPREQIARVLLLPAPVVARVLRDAERELLAGASWGRR